MFPFGTIVLARFPFTDLSGDKRRPALGVSRDNDRRDDLVVCFITSVPRVGPDIAPLDPTAKTGLKVASAERFDKIATLERSVIAGRIGSAPDDWLRAGRPRFFGAFGFDTLQQSPTPPASAPGSVPSATAAPSGRSASPPRHADSRTDRTTHSPGR